MIVTGIVEDSSMHWYYRTWIGGAMVLKDLEGNYYVLPDCINRRQIGKILQANVQATPPRYDASWGRVLSGVIYWDEHFRFLEGVDPAPYQNVDPTSYQKAKTTQSKKKLVPV